MAIPAEEIDVRGYFTLAEWSCMVTIEKNRVANILRNYKCLLLQGIDTKAPDFIMRYENRKRQELEVEQVCKSEATFVQLSGGDTDWEASQGSLSYGNWEGSTDTTSPDDENSMKENLPWMNASTSNDENCPDDFCQYCYILQLFMYCDSKDKLPNPRDCYKPDAIRLPLIPSSSTGDTNCQGRCQSLAKTNFKLLLKEQQADDLCCQECGQKFAKQKYLKNHIKRFSLGDDIRVFKCMFCSHAFVHEKHRKCHERVQHRSKLVPCCHCAQSFADLTSARIHIYEAHRNRMHVCDECGMSYSNSSHLMRHKREVRRHFSHQCYTCGHRYMTAVSLARHKLHHNTVKLYKCKICLIKFYSKTQLKKHWNSRNTDKKYECQNCKVKFLAHKSLKKHERIFNGDRPYKCEVCGHAYNSRARLSRHVAVHNSMAKQGFIYRGNNYVNC